MITTGSLLKRLETSQAWEFTKSINSISEKKIAIHFTGGSRYRFTGAYRDNRYNRDIVTPLEMGSVCVLTLVNYVQLHFCTEELLIMRRW